MSRGWVEFIGIILLAVSMSGLAFLSGIMPILTLSSRVIGDMTVRLLVTALIGGALMVVALRQEGRKWRHVVIVPLVIMMVVLAVIFVPLWAYFSYLKATNPFAGFRIFR